MTMARTPAGATAPGARSAGPPSAPRAAAEQALATAAGRLHRADPVLPRTGGPAGNARLTAWLGLTLLVLFLAELGTLLDVRGLITWHLALGLLLVPPSLVKTATTGWRMVRYYTGHPAYRLAGPPPLLLRLLGPLVVLGTLAVLVTGVTLVLLGQTAGTRPFLTVAGQGISPLTLHQGGFVLWAAATGLHVLARLVPAAQLLRAGAVAGGRARLAVLSATVGLAAVVAVLVVGLATSWTSGDTRGPDGHGPRAERPAAQQR